MRQHVNPLSQFFQLPIPLPGKADIFAEPTSTIHLDIGSARGEFLIKIAANYQKWNFLGVEIRKSLVISAERQRSKFELNNLSKTIFLIKSNLILYKIFSSLIS